MDMEDYMCSICMCIFVEPVTMPCSHTLCMPCFKQNVESTSLTCPLCRKRISTWARRAANNNALVNNKLWKKIQDMFPDKVQKRLHGEDNDDEASLMIHQPVIAQPGEIRQEYEEHLKRLERERELEQKHEQEASEALIRKLEAEHKVKSVEQQLIEEKDQELAKELESVVNEAGVDSPFNLFLKESRNRLTRSRGSSVTSPKQSPLTIESFLQKMRDAEKLKKADRCSSWCSDSPYPYKCNTPSKTSLYTDCSRTSIQSSTSCTSYNSDVDIELEVVSDNLLLEDDQFGKKLNETSDRASVALRSSSIQSSDSINPELNHFKPIRTCPVTPPKRLASGKVMETPLIRTTPRNLHVSEPVFPPTSKCVTKIDANSQVIQRRLSDLEEARKLYVHNNSKSTETECNSNENKNDISKYFTKKSQQKQFSPSECIQNHNLYTEKNVPLKKVIIPLEPIFDHVDDIKDFDDVMAPLMEIHNIPKNVSIQGKKVKCRNTSETENINSNAILSQQRSITDWLSQTVCVKESSDYLLNDSVKEQKGNVNSKDCISETNKKLISHNTNKLRLKNYPKRKHTAYHISDYVYPQISPKKKKVCIELISSDEETSGPSESDGKSVKHSVLPQTSTTDSLETRRRKLRRHSEQITKTGIKKLKSVKSSKNYNKHEQLRTVQTLFLRKNRNIKTKSNSRNNHLDKVFKGTKFSEKLKQEEADRQLAVELQKLFKLEEKNKCSAIRMKGSDNEYNFRRKSRTNSVL